MATPLCLLHNDMKVHLLILMLEISTVYSSTYYVAAPNGDKCESDQTPCHDLLYYSTDSHTFFTNHTIFTFLPGTHYLDQTVLVSGVENLTLQGLGEKEAGFHETVTQTTVEIECRHSEGGLAFLNVINLTLSGLTITECNSKPLTAVNSTDLSNFFQYMIFVKSYLQKVAILNTSLSLFQVSNLKIFNVSIQNATQVGLAGINVFNAEIVSSSFSINNLEPLSRCLIENGGRDCHGANVIIGYTYFLPDACFGVNTVTTLLVRNCNFSFAFSSYKAVNGGGLSIFIDNYSRYLVRISMANIQAYNNTDAIGGNINFITSENSNLFSLSMSNVSSKFGNRAATLFGKAYQYGNNPDDSRSGGGLHIEIGVASKLLLVNECSQNYLESPEFLVTISSGSFTENSAALGGGVYISVDAFQMSSVVRYISLLSCDISSNHGIAGIGMSLVQTPFTTYAAALEFNVFYVNVTLNSNVFPGLPGNGSSVYIQSLQRLNLVDFGVADNSPAAGAQIISTYCIVQGTGNIFRNNTAPSGGALGLYLGTLFFLIPPAMLYFIDNKATIQGGAIYVDTGSELYPYCFFQIQSANDTLHPVAEWHFINNTAGISGDAIYGVNLPRCILLESSSNVARQNTSKTVFDNTFFFIDQFDANSPVSSDPLTVCFCTGKFLNCNLTSISFEKYPGSDITLPFATVDIFQSFAQGIVEALQTIKTSDNTTVKFRYPFFNEKYCAEYTYTLFKYQNTSSFILSFSVVSPMVNTRDTITYRSINVSVMLLPCPPGFFLSSNSCVCDEALTFALDSNISCNINTQHITRNGDVWIGYENTSGCLFVENDCPFDYCVSDYVSFSAYFPDSQCSLRRSGILCGNCSEGLSLMLGSNRCGNCSNNYLILIIAFALAGVFLIVLLLALNLTVSIGTINGLIFTMNVIKIYESAFFTNGPIPFLSQFVSWINLDLGIETCFCDGLNALLKSWLQFVFPIYIWILIMIVIIICKYSGSFSRLIGHNILPVFATLILLSYTKLFRVIVPILQFTKMSCNITGESMYFWSRDGNVPYTSLEHSALLVFSLLVFVLLIIPFTLIIFLHSPLLTKINSPFFHVKFKPLFDAYYGPYKKNCFVWTGVLLVARLLLVITASVSTVEIYRSICITVISILFTGFILFQGVYTSKVHNVIECFFLLNLSILLAFVQYSQYVTFAGVSLAICSFFGICFHQFYKLYIEQRCRSKTLNRHESLLTSAVVDSEDAHVSKVVGRTFIEAPKPIQEERRRESLLFDISTKSTNYTRLS